jgi:hypothetical protein
MLSQRKLISGRLIATVEEANRDGIIFQRTHKYYRRAVCGESLNRPGQIAQCG